MQNIERGIPIPFITHRRITEGYEKPTENSYGRKWTDNCRYWTSKVGSSLMTYFDIDANGYRTAKGSWKVRF